MADISCIKTFNDLLPMVKGTIARIKFTKKNNTVAIVKELQNLIVLLSNLGSEGKIDQNIKYDEVKELANTINSLVSQELKVVTVSELYSMLVPETKFGDSGEPKVNDSLDSPEVDMHESPSSDFLERVYQNSAALSYILRFFQNATISRIMVNLKEQLEILGDSESLNTELLKLLLQFYEHIISYIDLVDPDNNLSKELYVDDKSTLPTLTEYIKNSSNQEVNKFYDFSHEPQTTLAEWRNKATVGEEDYMKRINAYNSYFILRHFDSMLTKTFKSLIQYRLNEKNVLTKSKGKYRYSFVDDYNKIVTWQQEDLLQKGAYDIMPKSLQTFIESCELLDFTTGEKPTGLYLNKDHITYFISKIKKDFRSPEYNSRPIAYIVNARSKSLEQIAEELLCYDDIIDKSTLSKDVRMLLALLLKSRDIPVINKVSMVYLKDLVNDVRHHPDTGLKLLFDIRSKLKKTFPTTIEERIFKNLYHYFFKDEHSLYSSSFRMYSQLALLFDTTSISDYTQYKIDNNGKIALITLNPSRLSLEVNIFRSKINSLFVSGECDDILTKYKVDKIYTTDKNQTRIVTFLLENYKGDLWKFKFNARAPLTQRWTLTKETKEGNITQFNPGSQEQGKNIVILTKVDFNVLRQLAKDVLGLDLYNNRELETAYLDQFKDATGTVNYHEATLNLINSTVPILANIKIFREKPANLDFITNINALRNDVVYTYRIKSGNTYVNGTFYLTSTDKPYLTELGELDKKTISRKLKGRIVKHLTREELKNLQKKGAEFGTSRKSAYSREIDDWYGQDSDALRINYKYQGVDLVSDMTKQYLEKFVNAKVLLNGSTFKTQVRTAENTTLTIGQSSTLFAERFNRLEKYSNTLNPMHVLYDELQQACLGYAISREGTKDTEVKQHRNFNFKENYYSSFVLDFLMPMYMGAEWDPRFTEAVLSDKIPIPKEIISKDKILSTSLATAKIHDILGDAYRLSFTNIEDDLTKIREFYKAKTGEDVPLTIMDNFTAFNEYCRKLEILENPEEKPKEKSTKPLEKLKEMSLEYNKENRTKPIAIGENIHYHINKKTGNVEMVFSLLEALTTYTLLSEDLLKLKKQNLQNTLDSRTEREENKFAALRRKDLLESLYKLTALPGNLTSNVYSWNSKVINLILANNTRQQLGSAHKQFKARFITGNSPLDVESAKKGNFIKNPFDNFIRSSQLSFVSDLLKNDASLNLRGSLDEVLLIDFVDGIFDNLEEYKQKLKVLGDTKQNREALKKDFMKLWCTYNDSKLRNDLTLYTSDCNDLVYAIVETYNEKTKKYEPLYEPKVLYSTNTEGETIKTTVRKPIQIATRTDLRKLEAYDESGTKVEYYSSNFDLSKLNLFYKGKPIRLRLNPILEQFNINSYLWTSLSSFATVGSHIWSDAKGGTNTLLEECLKWYDNNKRNVIISATKLLFKLGDIWGIPNEANIAVIDDIIARCSGIMGDVPTVKPYDGATFVNPFMYIWENISLNNQITGLTKKPIYEFYDERLMASGLIKTASFAIYNNLMRNSQWAERMMWKMCSNKWIDPDPNNAYDPEKRVADVDLTLGFGEKCPGLQAVDFDTTYKSPKYFDVVDGKMYVREIIKFEKLNEKNTYEITTRLLDVNTGKEVEGTTPVKTTEVIDNNYKFWKVLGGYESCKLNEDTNEFEYSEASIRTVAEWASKVKFRRQDNTYYQVKYGNTHDEALYNFKENPDKFTFRKDSYMDRDNRINYCPMKESDIHYLVTKGAIKKYAANVNSKEEYFSDKALNFFKIRMLEAGIQLDPTHDADLSIVSMMTQVISALAERGYTSTEAQEVYEALSELTSLAISDGMNAFNKFFETNDRADLQTVVSKLIVDEFAFGGGNDKGINLAKSITKRLIEEGKKGQLLTFKQTQGVYPFSDPSMFSLLLTTITAALNKKAIKTKLFGVLAVLNPSHEIHKMFGTKKLSELKSILDLDTELEYLPTLNSLNETQIGRTYQIIFDEENLKNPANAELNGQIIELKDSDYYYLWKFKLAGKNYKLKEILYTEGLEFTGELENIKLAILNSNNLFNFFNVIGEGGNKIIRISDVDDLNLKKLSDLGKITSVKKLNLYGRNLGSYNVHVKTENGIFNRYDLQVVLDSVLHDISNKIKSYKIPQEDLEFYDPTVPIELLPDTWNNLLLYYDVDPDKSELWSTIATIFRNTDTTSLSKIAKEKLLQTEMFAIKDYSNINVYDNNNQAIRSTVQSYKVKNFEAILPKIYATLFGLRKGDSVSQILNNKYFFLQRIIENYTNDKTPRPEFYDICFKRSDGVHVYVKLSENPEELTLDNFEKLSIDKYKNDNGVFRMHPYKENAKLYPLADYSDEVYYDRDTKTEVIVTKDLSYYIKNLKYLNIELSRLTSEDKVMNAIQDNKRKLACSILLDRIKSSGGFLNFLLKLSKTNDLLKEYISKSGRSKAEIVKDLKDTDKELYALLERLGNKQHVSFKQSLNFTVARIPAQGMQSFMAMEIVGFNDTGVNDCYVSAEQIRLQGSDYDVDKATFMGFAFDKSGVFVKWSPFFLDLSYKLLQESMEYLPYPTGRKIQIIDGDTDSIDFQKYKDLFTEKIIRVNKNIEENEQDLNNTEEKTILMLKGNRTQAEQKLLGELIKDVNKLQKEEWKKGNKSKTLTITTAGSVTTKVAKAIEAFVNKHNNYINVVEKEEKENLLKNFVAYKTYSISRNPVNSIAGETSVDESAKPFKDLTKNSNFGTRPEYNRPGNIAILWSALLQNHTGKDVIAIAASTGLKCLHAMTQAYNRAIANGQDLSTLWFDVEIENPDGSSEIYNFLADAYLGIKPYLNMQDQYSEMRDRLRLQGLSDSQIDTLWERYENHKEWAGSNDSGILTLATDNAKELLLERLNAGVDLAGLYLYGISLGMSTEDIFKIMTSLTALVVSRLTKGNLFEGPRFLDRLDGALDFLSSDPSSLPKTRIAEDKMKLILNTNKIEGISYKEGELKNILILDGKNTIKETIIELTRRGEFDKYLNILLEIKQKVYLNEAAKASNSKRGKFKKRGSTYGLSYDEIRARKAVNRLIEFACSINEIVDSHIKEFGLDAEGNIIGHPFANLSNIKILSAGEKELGNTRTLLGLNQGQKTKMADIYNFYETFANILKKLKNSTTKKLTDKEKKQLKEYEKVIGKDLRVDFHKFNNDVNYQKAVIDAYDIVKQSINPYWVVTQVPHFNLYLQAAHLIYLESRVSAKNRLMIDTLVPYINTKFKPSKTTRNLYYQKALTFIDGLMTNAFLREEKYIEIPAGNKIFTKSEDTDLFNYQVYNHPVYIELGTQEGNETFRTWMNNEVIPNLIKDKTYTNSFLRDLIPAYSDNTPAKNNIKVYTLPIDMIPKSDTELDQLSKYMMDFYRLRNSKYEVSDTTGYTITDLFFYYNLINFLNKGGAQSLTSMFDNFIKTNEPSASNRYIEFISNLDTEYNFKEGIDYTLDMLDKALALNVKQIGLENAESRRIPYVYVTDSHTLVNKLHKFAPNSIKEIKEAMTDISDEGGFGLSIYENHGYLSTESDVVSMESLGAKDTHISVDSDVPISIKLDEISATIQVSKKNGKVNDVTLSNIYTEANGKQILLAKDLHISGEEATKYIKVGKTEDGEYTFKINPISLLVKLSSLKRAC